MEFPAPHLDHVFLTVDLATMIDISTCSMFVDELLGRFRIKQAHSTLVGSYRTANLAGTSTFIEFFPDAAPPFAGTTTGVVLSFDRPGQSQLARRRLTESTGAPADYELVRRTMDGADEPQPWYHLTRPPLGVQSPITLFLSEITPEYFAGIGARPGPTGTQDRAEYLTAAMKAQQTPDQLLRDIVGLTLRLRPQRAGVLTATLKAIGYRTEVVAGHPRIVLLHGPGVTIEIRADEQAPEGLLRADLSLTRPYPRPGHTVLLGGTSTLVLSPNGAEDTTAQWDFTPVSAVEPAFGQSR